MTVTPCESATCARCGATVWMCEQPEECTKPEHADGAEDINGDWYCQQCYDALTEAETDSEMHE